MRLNLLKCKIHRLVVTDANLEYEGSFTIDEDLMDAAGILEYERIDVLNVTNGARLTTYAIRGPRGSHVACANGAAAHHVRPGDVVIVAAWADLGAEEAREHEPTIVLVGQDNVPKSVTRGTRREAIGAG